MKLWCCGVRFLFSPQVGEESSSTGPKNKCKHSYLTHSISNFINELLTHLVTELLLCSQYACWVAISETEKVKYRWQAEGTMAVGWLRMEEKVIFRFTMRCLEILHTSGINMTFPQQKCEQLFVVFATVSSPQPGDCSLLYSLSDYSKSVQVKSKLFPRLWNQTRPSTFSLKQYICSF